MDEWLTFAALVGGFVLWAWFVIWWLGSQTKERPEDVASREKSRRIMACPVLPDHALILHPISLDRMSCMFCPYDAPVPRGAPESPVERIGWARAHGMLDGQGGVSVAYLEALERAG